MSPKCRQISFFCGVKVLFWCKSSFKFFYGMQFIAVLWSVIVVSTNLWELPNGQELHTVFLGGAGIKSCTIETHVENDPLVGHGEVLLQALTNRHTKHADTGRDSCGGSTTKVRSGPLHTRSTNSMTTNSISYTQGEDNLGGELLVQLKGYGMWYTIKVNTDSLIIKRIRVIRSYEFIDKRPILCKAGLYEAIEFVEDIKDVQLSAHEVVTLSVYKIANGPKNRVPLFFKTREEMCVRESGIKCDQWIYENIAQQEKHGTKRNGALRRSFKRLRSCGSQLMCRFGKPGYSTLSSGGAPSKVATCCKSEEEEVSVL
eukprot:Lankesteria_metandrocarpae@DN7095_c0_g1_i1.p1